MKYLTLGILCFCIGVLLGENHRGKGQFFNSWYGNELYYREVVKVKNSSKYSNFYNKYCSKMTIIGLQAISDDNIAWVLLENCSWNNYKLTTDAFSQNELEKK